jgi:membrane associated rhomboid family serine protease
MIPLRDINPRRRFPLVTLVLILLNALVFVYELLMPSENALNSFMFTWGLVPARLMQMDVLAILTIFSSMFIHSGFMHIIGNMLYLWIFGDNIESALGSFRFIVFYLLCGVGAALGQVLIDPSSEIPMIGASGAISGVMGGYLMLYPRAQVETLLFLGYFIRLVRLPAIVVLGMWIVTQLLSGLASLGASASGGVAVFAHIGGFAAGLVLVLLFRRPRWWE